jgi:hypothetical protein
MKLFILTIYMVHGQTTYGYKFLEKKNCEKVGKSLVSSIKQSYFKCALKKFN